jgi:hypothetical protein
MERAAEVNPSSEAKLTVINYWFHSTQSASALGNYSTGQETKCDDSSLFAKTHRWTLS